MPGKGDRNKEACVNNISAFWSLLCCCWLTSNVENEMGDAGCIGLDVLNVPQLHGPGPAMVLGKQSRKLHNQFLTKVLPSFPLFLACRRSNIFMDMQRATCRFQYRHGLAAGQEEQAGK